MPDDLAPMPAVAGLRLLSDNTHAQSRHRTWLVSEKDHPKKVVGKEISVTEYFSPEDPEKKPTSRYVYKGTSTRQKYVCVGGPLEGQWRTEAEAGKTGYLLYNRSSGYGASRSAPKAVLVLLPEDAIS